MLVDISLISGARRLTRGIRTGNVGVAVVGAILTAMAIARRGSGPKSELVQVVKVKPGQTVEISVTRPD